MFFFFSDLADFIGYVAMSKNWFKQWHYFVQIALACPDRVQANHFDRIPRWTNRLVSALRCVSGSIWGKSDDDGENQILNWANSRLFWKKKNNLSFFALFELNFIRKSLWHDAHEAFAAEYQIWLIGLRIRYVNEELSHVVTERNDVR